jgi:hypothetical protein
MARSNAGTNTNWLINDTQHTVAIGAPLSMSCWFYPANLTANMNLIAASADSGNYLALAFDGANAYAQGDNKLVLDAVGTVMATTTTVASANTWNHAACYRDGAGNGGVYLNGGGKTSGGTNVYENALDTFEIGGFSGDSSQSTCFSPLNGRVAEVGVWSVVLTDDEFAALGRGVSPLLIRPGALLHYFPLYGQADLTSRQGAGSTMTIKGTMAAAEHVPTIIMPMAPETLPAGAGPTAYSLTADQGSYTLTGQAANLVGKNVLVAAQGTYTLTGQNAGLTYSSSGSIALVKSAEGVSTSATTNPSFGSATTAGNLIVLAFAADDVTPGVGSGWNQSTGMNQVTFHQGTLWWRISAGETSYSYTINSANQSSWVLMEFSGVDANPYDISDGQAIIQDNSSYTTPAIAPYAGQALVVAALMGTMTGTADISTTDVTGWTNGFTNVRGSGPSGTTGTRHFVGTSYKLVTGDGSTTQSTGGDFIDVMKAETGLIISFKKGASGGTGTNTLTAAQGTYTLSGQPVATTIQRSLTADQGTYTLTGQDATLAKGNTLPADTGVYALTGFDANLYFSNNVSAIGTIIEAVDYPEFITEGLFFSVTDTNPPGGVGIIANFGVYTLTGQDANLTNAYRVLTADTGIYSLTGNDANLFKTGVATLTADTGFYSLTGFPAQLRWSGDATQSGGSGPRRNLVRSMYEDNPIWEPQPFDYEEEEQLLRLILSM